MSRPLRILYDNAYYHVMYQGAGRQMIFHDETDYQVFLSTLEEAQRQFGIEIHAYCLMDNHYYYLLLKTPRANLSVMRHINGLYTQGAERKNMPKKIAVYIAQKYSDYRLLEIADAFGLNHYGGVSRKTHFAKTARTLPLKK